MNKNIETSGTFVQDIKRRIPQVNVEDDDNIISSDVVPMQKAPL